MAQSRITIIGGGLAGSEAAYQAACRGVEVDLYEMRPSVPTPAHRTGWLAELVCSNSLKSNREYTAPWLLKEELRRAGSRLLQIASQCAVPAGQALAVDRERFAAAVTEAMESEPRIRIHRQELRAIPGDSIVIVATGPLTSDALADAIQTLTGNERLFFYDSISPIVDAETIDGSKVFPASRYGRSLPVIGAEPGGGGLQEQENAGDYLNCPFNQEEYGRFYEALLAAETVALHEFENLNYFESCLPIEELARRGRETLRFGPMKPVGLKDPRTGKRPYAAVQLRRENLRADSYNLVGFQNHLKFGEQKRILRLIPGLEKAEFLRYGQIHRNTYINAPSLLTPTLQLRSDPRIFFAGQICGVEGYVESIATGLLAGIHAARMALFGEQPIAPPRATTLGSLCHYVANANPQNYQPANIAFDLLPPLCVATPRKLDRQERRARQCQIALVKLEQWLATEQKTAV
ncbi:MAG: methylenetetrahydrofolate--tRNA-(uracil(54)-C(5))-methyltransferase (FADH(2)-oxidizing) TrmFO [Acidobacteria bacterium RIFCSPLOWO2_12_FULL_59_11]|nr:MAG: methylenetetrahydrofolate--tRNA-(uracil(54)-C(5))-methyltransferase (FADH(2)-oxidizing) TrmFO [Acidobacteria bacterium RIFCSPLOWO2_12_FULL_59_11]